MKHIFYLIFILLFTAVVSCTGGGAVVREGSGAVMPYNNTDVTDKVLYNLAFNNIMDDAIAAVQESAPSVPEVIGIFIEIHNNPYKKELNDILSGEYERGWMLVETDLLPMGADDMDALKASEPDIKIQQAAKVYFAVNLKGNEARVTSRFWVRSRHYHVIYYYGKGVGGWSLVKKEKI